MIVIDARGIIEAFMWLGGAVGLLCAVGWVGGIVIEWTSRPRVQDRILAVSAAGIAIILLISWILT